MKHIPNMAEGLQFEEQGHIYTYNGIVVPSVSEIIEPLYDFSRVSQRVLQEAAERGTEVHFAIEKLINYGYESKLDDEEQKFFEQFLLATKDMDYNNMICEAMFFNKNLNYAGTMDIILHNPDDDTYSLIDIKTSSQPSKAWAVQLTAYAEGAKTHGVEFQSVQVLQIRKDYFKWYSINQVKNVFYSLWTVYNFLKGE